MFAGNYAPEGWAFCNGATLSVRDNPALFSLISTKYGGDGVNTFNLPDFRGRIPVGTGSAGGLPNIVQGQRFGAEKSMIKNEHMPPHTHTFSVTAETGNTDTPNGVMLGKLAAAGANKGFYSKSTVANAALSTDFLTPVINQTQAPINNMMATLTVSYIIALTGLYPDRPN
ncbi:MAG: phage tail protein [Microvirgula sp.]